MTIRLLPALGRTARRWKNGGGVTRDVAVFPAGASHDDFVWRASIATIAAAGPFSPFPGVDRTLIVLGGELVMKIGDTAHRLRPGSAARRFAGEDPVNAAPVGEACTVLNIMVRRGACSARVDRWQAARATSAGTLLFLAAGTTSVTVANRRFDLSANDVLLLERFADHPMSIEGPVIAAELFGAAPDQFVSDQFVQ